MKSTRLYLFNLVMRLLPETRCFGFKASILRWCGASVGKNVRICSSAIIMGNGALDIGDDVWIGEGCLIRTTEKAGICIGSYCDLAPRVTLVTGTHEIDAHGEHVAGKGLGKPISIGDGSWLCTGSIVLPGVSIKAKTIVAAGAVVTKDVVEEGSIVAGVPAVEIGRIDD